MPKSSMSRVAVVGSVGKNWVSKNQGTFGCGKGMAGRGNNTCRDRSGQIIHENRNLMQDPSWENFQQWNLGTRGFIDGVLFGDRGSSGSP